MNHTSTFSMQHILNEPIDTNLCKRILEQIKSPLLEQSFAVTNDQSLSGSRTNAPKRPDIPPPSSTCYQYRRPAIKNKFSTFASGHNFYQESRRSYDENGAVDHNHLEIATRKYQSLVANTNKQNGCSIYPSSRVEMEMVVSPLDPNITEKKQEQKDFIANLWSHFCGNLYNLNNQNHQQIGNEESKSKFQRKKIFDQKAQSLLKATKQNKYTDNQVESILLINQNPQKSHISIRNDSQNIIKEKSVEQVLLQLKRNRYLQIAQFVGVITKAIELIKSAEQQRKFLLDNMQMVFQLITSENSTFQALDINDQRYQKFFYRMKCSSVSQMIKKISRSKLIQSHNSDLKQFTMQKNKVSQCIRKMLKSFELLEQTIQEFMQSPQAINSLRRVYTVLNEKFTKDTTKNTLQQIRNLLKDVRLFGYQKDAYQLEYLWDQFFLKILSQTQFINGLVRTNGHYQEIMEDSCLSNLESELSSLGFVRN